MGQAENMQAKNLFLKWVERLAPGQTTRCNHEGCPAGEDTRGRLYFSRKVNPDKMVVWYCHNCAAGGAFTMSALGSKVPLGSAPKDSEQDMRHIIDVMERSIDITEGPRITPEQYRWLQNSSSEVVSVYYKPGFVKWDPIDESLVFPIPTLDNEQLHWAYPLAMQKRYHRPYGPKCITTKANANVQVRRFLSPPGSPVVPTVIVEDLLSGYRIAKDAGLNAYVLFGNHMDISEFVQHKELFKHGVCVWLDNDNDQVTRNAAAIAKRASMLGLEYLLISELNEPKKYIPPILEVQGEQIKRAIKMWRPR